MASIIRRDINSLRSLSRATVCPNLAALCRLKARGLGPRQVSGALQREQQPLDFVELDRVAREARDVMREHVVGPYATWCSSAIFRMRPAVALSLFAHMRARIDLALLWLGREDSNLRMAESKIARPP